MPKMPENTKKTASTRPFYIRHLNANGKTKNIYAFQSSVEPPRDILDTPETTSNECEEYIHLDDNIEQIRSKILRQTNGEYKPHEIYFFAYIKENIDTLAIYQSITKQRDSIDIPITQYQMQQLLLNIGINTPELKKQSYTYEEILSYKTIDGKYPFAEQEFTMPVPLGRELYDRNGKLVRDYLFPANPYKSVGRIDAGSNIWVDRSANSLLMSYNLDNTIYMCTPDMPPAAMQHYFPTPSPSPPRGLSMLENSVDFLYELIYSGQGGKEMASVHDWTVKLKPPYQCVLPLDTIFANLYTSKQVPFVQYNPGRTRESVIRVRSLYKTFQGDPVPTLEMTVLDKILEDVSKKYETIALYLPPSESAAVAIYVILGKHGDVHFRMSLTDKHNPVPDLVEFIVQTCNPILDVLNNSMQPLGFSFSELKNPLPTYVSVSDIVVSAIYKGDVAPGIDLGKFAPVFHNLWDLKSRLGIGSNVIQDEDVFYFSRGGGENTRQALLEFHKYQCKDNAKCLSELFKYYDVNRDKLEGRSKLIKPITLLVRREGGGIFSWTVSNITSLLMLETINSYLSALFRCLRDEIKVDNDIYERYFPIKSLKWTVDAVEQVLVVAEESDVDISDDDDDDEGTVYSEPPPPMFSSDDEGTVYSEPPPPMFGEESESEPEYEGGADYVDEKTQIIENESRNKAEYDKLYAQYNHKKNVTMKQTNGVFNERRRNLDKELFYTSDGTMKFASTCQTSAERHPLPLTDEEYNLNPEYFSAYPSIRTGEKNMHYVCPPHYCLPKNIPMTDADVKAGKCMELKDPKTGIIMPDKTFSDNILPKDAFVYTFQKRNETKAFYPKVIKSKDSSDPTTPSVCCFVQSRANKKSPPSAAKTVVKEDKEPPQYRFGPNKDLSKTKSGDFALLPLNVQMFFQMYDSDVNVLENIHDELNLNNSTIKSQLLRYRVDNGSFIGCIADIAEYLRNVNTVGVQTDTTATSSVQQFIEQLTEKLTLDDYIQYDNGGLVALFRPKHPYEVESLDVYKDTDFYKSFLTKSGDLEHEDFLEDTVRSFEAFKEYLRANPGMDHTYLWDIAVKNPMYPPNTSINLIILDVKHDSITNKVDIICPTNSRNGGFQSDRPSLILLRMGENQYEPIYHMKKETRKLPVFIKLFDFDARNIYIRRVLTMISKISRDLCKPSTTVLSKFKRSLPASEVYAKLVGTKLFSAISRQIQNYKKQTIGFIVEITVNEEEEEESSSPVSTVKHILVPCWPSPAVLPTKLPIARMDADITDAVPMWSDYKTTVDVLTQIADETGLPCRPYIASIQEDETDSYLVGIFTETNQFVKISPPVSEDDMGDLPDGMIVKRFAVASREESDYMKTDVVLATSGKRLDSERLSFIQEKMIDRDYFALFRKLVREKFQSGNRAEITQLITSDAIYPEKLQKVKQTLINLCDSSIDFQETAEEIWSICSVNTNDAKCNIMVVDGKIAVPTRKGQSQMTRERYYTRIADELVRYGFMRQVMLLPQTRLVPREEDIRFTPGPNETVATARELKQQVEARIDFYNRTGTNLGNVPEIDYEHALPRGSTNKFLREVRMDEQQKILLEKNVKVKSTSIMQRALDLISECAGHGECGPFTAIEMIGNERTGYWKSRFMSGSVEISAGAHKNNILSLIIFQLTHGRRFVRMDGVKTLFETELAHLVSAETKKKYTLKHTAIKQPDVLTEYDLYILAQAYKLPICLFTTHGFQRVDTDIQTLIRLYKPDDDANTEYYFLRTLSENKSLEGSGRSYLNLIYPPQPIPADVEIVDVSALE